MKSIHQRLGEAVEKLTDAGKFKAYREAIKECTSVEAKLNCAEKLLSAKVSESHEPITKHNGAADNGRITEFRESGMHLTTEQLTARESMARSNALLLEGMTHPVTKQPLTEAEKRKLLGLKPAEYDTLTERQRKEYDSARMFGFNEADALTVARVSR